MNNGHKEQIIRKEDADRVFSLTKPQWKEFASKFFAPDWTLRIFEYDTGLGVSGFNPSNGFGISLQPLYSNDTDPPMMLIVGNYFPLGQVVLTDEMKKELEGIARAELGPTYEVKLRYDKTEKFDIVEFLLTKV